MRTDIKFIKDTPAVDRRGKCIVCGRDFNQFIRGQVLCDECLDAEDKYLAEQDEKAEIARDIAEEEI